MIDSDWELAKGVGYKQNIKHVKTEVVVLTMLPPAPIKR